MAETSLPNPGSTIIYFLAITIVLIAVTIAKINSAKTISAISASRENNIHNIVYILVLIIGSYFINVTISKAMCSQSIQWGYILLITLLPWIIIFITLYGILYLFPGWINPFSNTIGYLVILALGIEKTYDNIFKTGEEASENPELVKAIANMNSNKTKFVNQISSDIVEFIEFFKNMKNAIKSGIVIPENPSGNTNADIPTIDATSAIPKVDASTLGADSTKTKTTIGGAPGDGLRSMFRRRPKETAASADSLEPDSTKNETNVDHLLKLYQLLVIKQFIGKMVWYILAGILICSISYNLIISMSCEKSVAEITKDFETARAEITESRLNVAPQPLAAPSGIELNSSSTANLTAGLTQRFGTQ